MPDQPTEQRAKAGGIDQPTEGEHFPKDAMEPGELDDQPHPPGWMFAVEDKPHTRPFSLHFHKTGDLVETQGWVPVVPDSVRTLVQLNPHPPQTLTQFQVLPAIEAETGVKQA